MRKMMFAALAACLAATPAYADWGATKWGDSLDTVIANASEKPAAVPARDGDRVGDLDRLAVARSTFGTVEVEVQFYFDASRRLAAVRLQPKPDDCARLATAAAERYGKPVEEKNDDVGTTSIIRRAWRDTPNNMVASFAEAEGKGLHFCNVFIQSPARYDADDPAV